MINVKNSRVKIDGPAEEIISDFVCLYQVMNHTMPDVLEHACDIIENLDDDDVDFIKFKDKRPGDI